MAGRWLSLSENESNRALLLTETLFGVGSLIAVLIEVNDVLVLNANGALIRL